MSRTDKDVPFQHRERAYIECECWRASCQECRKVTFFGTPDSSNHRHNKRLVKRQGNKRVRSRFKQPRYSRIPFWDYKTVRTERWFL